MHLINMHDPKESEQYLIFAKKIALTAGTILEEHRHSFTVEKIKDKLNLDIATSADYAAEKSYIKAIQSTYPTHGVMAEESGITLPNAEYVWIIDPLDGTKEYTRNTPYYYTLISLEYKGSPVCAVGYQPAIRRMFSGSVANGAFIDNMKMHLSSQPHLDKSFVFIGIPNKTLPKNEVVIYLQAIQDLMYASYRLRNTQWDVEGLFNVAMGIAEAYVLPPSTSLIGRPKWWDISSGLQMVGMAGGKVTNFYGNPIQSQDSSKGIVASNKLVHNELLNLLKKHYPQT